MESQELTKEPNNTSRKRRRLVFVRGLKDE